MSLKRFDVVLLGGLDVGSIAAVEKLGSKKLDVLVVAVTPVTTFAPGSIAPIRAMSKIETLSRELGFAFKSVTSHSEISGALSGVRADLVLSSCFPWRLPIDVIGNVASRCFNIHPSRLPAWRGPDPLFWQLRAGYSKIPVSIHELAHRIDTGAVVASSNISILGTDSETSLQTRIAQEGVELACNLDLSNWAANTGDRGVPGRGYWHRSPRALDYRVFPTWGVEHATRFVGLMADRGVPFSYTPPGQARIEFRRILSENSENSPVFSINLADGAIRVLMKNRA